MIASKSSSQRKYPSAVAILRKIDTVPLGAPPKFKINLKIQRFS